jgi:type IV pilus assembly protein PilM
MFGIGSKSIVGLDVGSSSIKAVELKKKGGQIEVTHLGLEPLASDIVVDSMIVDSGTVSSAISKLFLDNQIKTKAVATAVSGHSVIVKKISLPSMSDQELAETIEKEAAQHIPFDLSDGRPAGGSEEGQDSELHQRTLDGRTYSRYRGH